MCMPCHVHALVLSAHGHLKHQAKYLRQRAFREGTSTLAGLNNSLASPAHDVILFHGTCEL